MIARLLALASAVVATGCGPWFQAASAPPVGKLASLDGRADTIELSPGVALAFECHDNGGPCKAARASVDDPRVAGVAPAHLAELDAQPGYHHPRYYTREPKSAFVIWGIAPGRTTVRVTSEDGDGELEVTVVP